ncbi:MAG: STM4011 family radical SAM protein [Gordonia sp. (in: high G+C Gram-positive bacteria)]|uniref:STM4011 family radical SAM protein n=1 Tax=Gordonia sp. (in: high G+C Gram-positive bacteria) TaxID=84139 RepID=UPI0039E5A4DD
MITDLPMTIGPAQPISPAQATGPARPAGPAKTAELTVLYRGDLSSCNYDCPYCPFAKRIDRPEVLRRDRAQVERFVAWARDAPAHHERLSVLFTPWGEALTRSWYRRAVVELSRMPHVTKVAVQTNLSCRTGWLADADRDGVGLWATYHPGEVPRERFLARCGEVRALGIRLSVGVVGLPEHLDEARAVRDALPPEVYVWVNAAEGYDYRDTEIADWTRIDPHFGYSVHPHPSAGLPCRTGESAITVDGTGDVRRCHFVPVRLGNLYDGTYRSALRPRACPNTVCDCHIGYVHLETLPLYDVFAGGVLERVPALWPPVRAGTPDRSHHRC